MKKWLFILATLPMIFFSCRKDVDDLTITNTDYQPPVVIVTGNIAGLVIAENDTPVAEAIVRVGNVSTTTNEKGLFQFTNIEMNSRGTYVTIEKSGYFPGSTRFYPQNNSSNFTKFELLRKTIVGTVNGDVGGSVEVQGAKITLPAGSVVDALNNTYEGEIHVAAQWLDPTADNLVEIMPGNLAGVDESGREVAMETYGMLAVELQDADGNELQVAPGLKAELSFPVPAEIQGNAPSTIPLWSFDEEIGLWIEEGSATLQGSQYVGQVSHFSFWNCDWPYPLIYLTGTVHDQFGNPVANHTVKAIINSSGFVGYGYTDADGVFSGLVPANEDLTLEIANSCGELLSVNIGSFTEDADVGIITITNPESSSIAGSVVDCSNAGIPNSVVNIEVGNNTYNLVTDENGDFSTSFLGCSLTDLTVQAYDFSSFQQSELTTLAITSTVDAGQISICDNPIEEYISIDINGIPGLYLTPTLEIENFQDTIGGTNVFYSTIQGVWQVSGDTLNYDNIFTMYLNDLDVGTYTGIDAGVFFSSWSGNTFLGYFNCWMPCDGLTVNVTLNEGSGGFLEGNYAGMIEGYGINQQPIVADITGEFRVLIP